MLALHFFLMISRVITYYGLAEFYISGIAESNTGLVPSVVPLIFSLSSVVRSRKEGSCSTRMRGENTISYPRDHNVDRATRY